MKGIFITAIISVCVLLCSPSIENLNGKWTGTLKTDQGSEYPLLYSFKIDGDQLTGMAKTPKGDMPINDGKIDGDTFTFNVIVGKMEIDHSCKFYGDSVSVNLTLGNLKAHTSLKRAQ